MKKIQFCVLFSLLFLSLKTMSQETKNPIVEILSKSDGIIKQVFENAEQYEVQIIYTQIDRDKKNVPHFTNYQFNLDKKRYFYPASTVKMPISFLALEKINKLKKQGIKIDKSFALRIDSVAENQIAVNGDSTSQNGEASIEHYIKKVFLVSDNDAYNRLFEFLGPDYINKTLAEKNIKPLRITHRLSVWGLDNTITPSFHFYKGKKEIYSQNKQQAIAKYDGIQIENTQKGKGYYSGDELINTPMDFSKKNYFPLESMLKSLQTVIFPEAFPKNERFDLTKEDYQFLYKYMSMSPLKSDFPKYEANEYWDSYVKFFLFGDNKNPMPSNIKIFNKVGDAYGFLIDCAYIVDFDTNTEFFLTAALSVNEDQIYNDDKYEYDKIGFPFMANLGKEIIKFDQARKKQYVPDLKKFKQ